MSIAFAVELASLRHRVEQLEAQVARLGAEMTANRTTVDGDEKRSEQTQEEPVKEDDRRGVGVADRGERVKNHRR